MNTAIIKLATAVVAILALAWTSSARADYSVTCESRNNQSQSCPLRESGYVRLDRQLSSSACRQGRDWNYNRRQIRVWDGCRAVFSVSSSDYRNGRRHGNRDNHDAKVAAGVVAGALILGAIANANKNKDNRDGYSSDVPGWMVGTFDGYNAKYDADVTMTIRADGDMSAEANGSPLHGYVDGGALNVGGSRFYVEKTNDGFVTTESTDRSNEVYYRRR